MPDVPRLNVRHIDRTEAVSLEIQWRVFKSVCAIADEDVGIVAEVSAKLGLDLPAIKSYLVSQRVTAA